MKKTIATLIIVVTSVLLTLLLLEFAVRTFLPPSGDILFESYGDTYVCSPTVGWLGRPNYQGLLTREEYAHPIQFNAQGMYDTDHAPQKPDTVFRILWVGDSFAQTLQVAEPLTAHQQLEDMLNERLGDADLAFEVINTGVIGWGTGQELAYYREMGRLYQADLVLLLFFVGNDINNNLPGHALTIDGVNCFAPYFPVCDDTLDSEPWYHVPGLEPAWGRCPSLAKAATTALSSIQQNSALFARIEPLLLSLQERRTYGQDFGLPFAALYLPEASPEVKYGWRVTEGLLSQFNREAEADGADFAVAIVGPREVVWLSQLTPEQLQLFYQEAPAFATAEIDRPNRHLVGYLDRENIPALDLQQPMIDYIARTGAQLYLPIDRHWTVEGNRIAAELIFEWLADENLLEVSD